MDESDDTETEPSEEGELKLDGSHSPFGFVWQIAAETGWSVRYILWGVNVQTLLMMLADAPRYRRKVDTNDSQSDEDKELGFFQSLVK